MHSDTPRYPDEYIDHWGDVFQREAIAATLGITFERFLQMPHAWLEELDRKTVADRIELGSADFDPLLPKQAIVQQRLDAADHASATDDLSRSRRGEPAVLRGDRLIEPCHSHTYRARPTADRHNP